MSAHRQPDRGRGQRRRVVDAVAHHQHLVAVGLQIHDDLDLVLRQATRHHPIHSRDGADLLGGRLSVPRQQHRLPDARGFQVRREPRQLGPGYVGEHQQPGDAPFHCDEAGDLPLLGDPLPLFHNLGRERDMQGLHVAAIAHCDFNCRLAPPVATIHGLIRLHAGADPLS